MKTRDTDPIRFRRYSVSDTDQRIVFQPFGSLLGITCRESRSPAANVTEVAPLLQEVALLPLIEQVTVVL